MRLDREPDVIRMAAELRLPWRKDPVQEIVGCCAARISEWISEAPAISTIPELEELICDRLQLHFEEIWCDADLQEIVSRYTALGDAVFQRLLDDFDDCTFATLLRRKSVDASARDLYVAVIDCRGAKGSRRFFSRWHEIAHLLTAPRQLELPYQQRSTNKPPVERLMDHIAGEIGFFPELFIPALKRCVPARKTLNFAAVEAVREEFCPAASFHATLIACVRHSRMPIVHVEAGLGLKTVEKKALNNRQGRLFAVRQPEAKLRALAANPNAAARAIGLRIDRNMTVPESSVIAHLFNQEVPPAGEEADAIEELSSWRHSNGVPVGYGRIRVEARRIFSHVIAIIQPVSVESFGRRSPLVSG